MTKLNVKKYLGESEELVSFIGENQLTYLIAGCGMGKSYFTKEVLMKKYRVLNVNFLNTVNLQNFEETYVEGPSEAAKLDGMKSATINVQNLCKISDSAISNFDILIIDEIQKMYQDTSYRSCCGSDLVSNISRFTKFGKKVLVMTGTPVENVGYFATFSKVVVEKEFISDEDKYSFVFMGSTTKNNVYDLVASRKKKGEYVVILANSGRDKLKLGLERKGFKVGMVESDEKKAPSTATKYIIENQVLPDDVDVIIATTVLQEGINLNDLSVDNKITFITFIEDIQTPHQAIQFAGRARKQGKRLILCYNKEEEFNIEYSHCLYSGLPNTCLLDQINLEYEQIMSRDFNNKEDWKNIFTSYTNCSIKELSGKYYEKEEALSRVNPTDWNEVVKEILNNNSVSWKAKRLCEDISYKVLPYSSEVNHIFTDDCTKCRTIIKGIEKGLFRESIDDIDEYIKVIEAVSTFSYLLETTGTGSQQNTVIDFLAGNVKEDRFFEVYRELMAIKYTENGVEVSVESIRDSKLKQDTRKRIDKPYELMIKYIDTVKAILNKFNPSLIYKIGESKKLNASDLGEFYISMACMNPEKLFNKEHTNQQGTTRKGIYAKYKFELSSDSSIKFKTLDEAFEYCKNNGLTKCGNKESFRKCSKDIISKIK